MKYTIQILLAAMMFVQFSVADTLQRVPGHKFLVRDSGSTNKATIEVPSLSADYTMKLPSTMGSNGYVLKSNGSNATDWVNSLTNFSLTSPTIGDSITTTQISTPSTPSAGYNKIYTKSDNKLYVLDSSGVEKSAGGLSAWAASIPYAVGDIVTYSGNTYIAISAHTSGSTFEADVAAGGKWKMTNNPVISENLIKVGSNFEDNDVGGWTAVGCATVTTNFPACNGSGGAVFSAANGGRAKNAGTTDPAVVSSNPLNEVYSLNMATSGANAIGDMYISPKINIPIKYQAKTLSFKFDYKVMSGTIVRAGNNTNTLGVAIYDVTNNSWSQPTGVFSIDGAGIATGTWQVPSNTTAAQLAVYYINAAGGATSVYLDDFYLGPQITSMGSPITDWVSFTPTMTNTTGGITNATSTGKWRRVGDQLEVSGSVVFSGTPATFANLFVSLPSGLSIDTTKLDTTAFKIFGVATFLDTGNVGYGIGQVWYENTTKVQIGATSIGVHTGTVPTNTNVIQTSFPFAWGAGDVLTYHYSVPITGWSSNTTMVDTARTAPTITTLTSGTSQTYTTPAGVKYLRIRMVGGGGGGAGGGSGGGTGGTGGNTVFGAATASGGAGGQTNTVNGGAGGGASGGTINLMGGYGNSGATAGSTTPYSAGGSGGASVFGGQGSGGGSTNVGAGSAARSYTGAGGGGGGTLTANAFPGGGGGAGGYVEWYIENPSLTYTYTVGSAGTAGTAGTNGYAGGAGGSGIIIIEEYYRDQGALAASETVALDVTKVGNMAVTTQASEGSEVKITSWDSPSIDSHGKWDAANSQYTIPVSGTYSLTIKTHKATSTTAASAMIVKPFKGGTQLDSRFARKDANGVSTGTYTWNIDLFGNTRLFKFLAGDIIDVRIFQNSGGTVNFAESQLSIYRVGNY